MPPETFPTDAELDDLITVCNLEADVLGERSKEANIQRAKFYAMARRYVPSLISAARDRNRLERENVELRAELASMKALLDRVKWLALSGRGYSHMTACAMSMEYNDSACTCGADNANKTMAAVAAYTRALPLAPEPDESKGNGK